MPGWWVLHVDMDQFVVAVELARHPDLRGRPVLVGGSGDPTRRGVVSGASYEAREYGVHSGTPLRTAAARCPSAVFLPVDAPRYEAVSEQVMAALRRLPATVEVLGWDEAFLGARTDDPERLALAAQTAVRRQTGLACSVGIGENRLQAKTASVLAKPGGVRLLTRATWAAVMGERPVDRLWGVGPRTSGRLRELGVRTVAELAAADVAELCRVFGPRTGAALHQAACGRSDATVSAVPRRPRSRGRQVTYEHDLTDPQRVRDEVRRLARDLAVELAGAPVRRLVVIVRFQPFDTRTHGAAVEPPGADPDALEHAALSALAGFELDRPVRLLGVRGELGRDPARSG